MRAEFIESIIGKNLIEGNIVVLEKDDFHHLVKVARVQKGESILLLDGSGRILKCIVDSVSGKSIQLTIKEVTYSEKRQDIELAFCLPKKSATDDILKTSVEIGLLKIHTLFSEYSWRVFPKTERIKQILISAMKQSNNSFLPEVYSPKEILHFNFQDFSTIYYFCSKNMQNTIPKERSYSVKNMPELFLIGPEGGLSPNEEEYVFGLPNVHPVHLSTPILRAQTAVPVAFGYLLGQRNE